MTRRNILRLLAFILTCVCACTPLMAEGNCPPGSYPQVGQGWQSCVPIPGVAAEGAVNSQVWEERWGALAADHSDIIAGESKGQLSEREAVAAAIRDCENYGGTGCRQSAVYRNQCIAVVTGTDMSKTYTGPTMNSAEVLGMADCHKTGQHDCHVFYSGCSLPVRVR